MTAWVIFILVIAAADASDEIVSGRYTGCASRVCEVCGTNEVTFIFVGDDFVQLNLRESIFVDDWSGFEPVSIDAIGEKIGDRLYSNVRIITWYYARQNPGVRSLKGSPPKPGEGEDEKP